MRRLLIVMVLLAGLWGCGGDDGGGPTLVESSPTTADEGAAAEPDEAPPEPETFTVGDRVAIGQIEVETFGVTDPLEPTGEYGLPPAPGSRFVGVDVEVTNTTDEPFIFSAPLTFELKDPDNIAYPVTFTDHSPGPPDGQIGPGQARRGLLVFEVPEGVGELLLVFVGYLLSAESAEVAL